MLLHGEVSRKGGKTMGEVTYANFLTEAQANLWNLLKADTTLAGYTKNVLDGVPLGLTKGTGFPYVIVPTPEVTSEDYLTFTKKISHIAFRVSVFDRKESVLRLVCDAVRNACETNKVLFKNSYGMFRFLNANTSLSYDVQDDGAVVYTYMMNISYEWVAW
jgi:hypothetical protein